MRRRSLLSGKHRFWRIRSHARPKCPKHFAGLIRRAEYGQACGLVWPNKPGKTASFN